MRASFFAFGWLCLGVACGGAKPAVTSTPASVTTTRANDTTPKAVGNHLTVSADIYQMCHLDRPDTQAAPKFSYDDSVITKDDAVVLDRIASCLTNGDLRNRHVKLTGRADPRGSEQYNMSLGAKRAHSVTRSDSSDTFRNRRSRRL